MIIMITLMLPSHILLSLRLAHLMPPCLFSLLCLFFDYHYLIPINSFHSFPPGLSQSNCHGFGAWWWSSGKHYFILNSSNAIVCYRVNRHYITSKKSFVDLIGDFPFYLSYNSSDVSLENLALDQLIIFS